MWRPTNRPETVQVGRLVESEEMRLRAVEKRKARDRDMQEQNKAADINYSPATQFRIVGCLARINGGEPLYPQPAMLLYGLPRMRGEESLVNHLEGHDINKEQDARLAPQAKVPSAEAQPAAATAD
ncbi:hypothetical protein PG988_007445 [Apiospora saccharicola]